MGNPYMEPCKYSKCKYPARMINKTSASNHKLKKHDGKSYHDICLIKMLAEESKRNRG